MKNKFMNIYDKLILRKKTIIESIHDELKNIYQIEHTRYRSAINYCIKLISGIVTYNFLPKKLSL